MTPNKGIRKPWPDRFWAKVDKTDTCWLWRGTLTRPQGGYGQIKVNGRLTLAHRAAYELLVGPIPDGLTIDHLCRVRQCVRPSHLEPVTARENTLRGTSMQAQNAAKTQCTRGHELSGDNLAMTNGGRSRRCRKCKRDNETRRILELIESQRRRSGVAGLSYD